jgi:hypothetical protein
MRGYAAAMRAVLLGAPMVIGVVVGAAGDAEAKESQEYTAGQWTGFAYTDDDSGQFTDCTVWASNRDNVQIGISVLTDWSLRLYLYSKNWDLPQNQSYPVSYWVDRGGQYHGKVATSGKSTVYVDVDEDNNVFQDLKAGSALTIRTSSDDYVFDLAGSRNALSQLVDCVDRHAKAATTNPFGPGSGGDQNGNGGQQQANQQQNDQQQTNQQQGSQQQDNGDSGLLTNPTASVDDVRNFIVEVTGAKPSMITASANKDKAGGQYYTFKTPLGEGQFWQRKVGSSGLQDMADSYVAKYKEDCKGGFESNPNQPVQGDHGQLISGTASCAQSPYQNNGPEFISYSIVQNEGVYSYYLTYTGGNAAKAKSDPLGHLIEKRYEDLVK